MATDKNFCMSSYLMYRYIYDADKDFGMPHQLIDISFERTPIKTSDELLEFLENEVKSATSDGKAALALSGGIDSAILAYFMPKNGVAYTFRCVVDGKKVLDESERAAYYAKKCGLRHKVIEIRWEDVESVTNDLMKIKGAPVHSIETQIYIAAKRALEDGFDKFIFGENADIIFGGMDGLLAKDWLFGEFVERYSYVMPYKVLKNPQMPLQPFFDFEKDGHIDGHDFINKYFRQEALGTYNNACDCAGIKFVGPYSKTYLAISIDYARIRGGESKYLIREAYKKLYQNEDIPQKIPMPRPVNEWFKNWNGPTREEFIPHCTDNMTGNQKWMVWCLERFLNLIEVKNYA